MTPDQTTFDVQGYSKGDMTRQNAVKISQGGGDARLVFIAFGMPFESLTLKPRISPLA